MKSKTFYEEQFASYPDLVDLLSFRRMLGGIGDSFARKLIHEKYVQAVFIKPHYWITKKSVIEYLLSDDYGKRRLKVRA